MKNAPKHKHPMSPTAAYGSHFGMSACKCPPNASNSSSIAMKRYGRDVSPASAEIIPRTA
jgi:hypothetical protein